MTQTTAPLAIDFKAIAGEDSTAPQGSADATLARIDPSQPLESFSCRADLKPEQRAELKVVAAELYERFWLDRTKLSSFGDTALDGLNNTVAQILAQQGNLRIPEVERITKELAKTVGDFRRKYKNSDPKFLNALEKFADAVAGIFTAGRQFFQELYIDSQKAVTRLDGVAARLIEHKFTLDRNVLLCDELYKQNEVAMTNLIGTIAMMEELLDLFAADGAKRKEALDQITATTSVERRDKEEQLNVLLEMQQELEVRRSEFVSRLFVAWATAPQIRNLRKVSNSLSQRLHLLVVLTIPTMKLTIAQWGMLLQLDEAGKASETVTQANNDALTEFATATSEAIPRMALLVQTPSILPETITALADSVVAQNEGIVSAFKEGQRMRAELDDTVVKSMRVINNSGKETRAELMALLTRTKNEAPLALEQLPEIPDAVNEYAQQQAA